MWDLEKTRQAAEGMLRRKAQGKPLYDSTPEELAYWDARSKLSYLSMEEIDARTTDLRDAAYPGGDWPGRGSADS